jgi:hypothetical protein
VSLLYVLDVFVHNMYVVKLHGLRASAFHGCLGRSSDTVMDQPSPRLPTCASTEYTTYVMSPSSLPVHKDPRVVHGDGSHHQHTTSRISFHPPSRIRRRNARSPPETISPGLAAPAPTAPTLRPSRLIGRMRSIWHPRRSQSPCRTSIVE